MASTMEDHRDYAQAHFQVVGDLPSVQVCTMAAWLQVRRMPNVEWRHVLNSHTTNRPIELRPNLVRCLEDHLTSSPVTSHGTGQWRTELKLPCSFEHGDGRSHALWRQLTVGSEAVYYSAIAAVTQLVHR